MSAANVYAQNCHPWFRGKESHLNRLFVEDNSGAIELELFCYVQNLLEVWNRKRELVEECDLDRLVEGP